MAPPIALVGTGSFALDVLDWCTHAGSEVPVLLEPIDRSRVGTTIHGRAVAALDDPDWLHLGAVIALNADRLALAKDLASRPAASVVHPTAQLGIDVDVGDGAIIGPGTIVGAAATIGLHVLVNRGCLIGHHTSVGAGAVVNPGSNVGGNTSIGDGSVVGMGAVVVNGRRVGEGATIAAGSVVVRDIDPGTRVQGVPARPFVAEAG